MKEIYEEPKLQIIGFLPKEKLAAEDWDWAASLEDDSGNTGSEVDVEFGNNPEGNFG